MGGRLLGAEQLLERLMAHEWAWRILIGLGMVVVGLWLARWLARALDRLMLRFEVDAILRNFLRNLAYALTAVVVIIAALDTAGVPTSSLLAVVGAAGLAIGLALKDSLSNIASGVMLIVLRPFRAGDAVQIAGVDGVIEQVRIFQTVLRTAQNHTVILPNSQITNTAIVNYTAKGERRIDLPVGIGYGEDIAQVRDVLLGIAGADRRVLREPPPEVAVTALGDSSIALVLRAWVRNGDYGPTQSALFEAVHREFTVRSIDIPYPQHDLHIFRHDAPTTG